MHSDIYNLHREKRYFKLAQLVAAIIRTLILFLILAGIRLVVGHGVGWISWIPLAYLLLENVVIYAEDVEGFTRNYMHFMIRFTERILGPLKLEKRYESEKEYLEELEKKKREKTRSVEDKKKDK
jgi:hypothetical protein